MKILVDTREQAPLEFSHPMITEVRVVKLDVGDYGVMFEDGHIPSVFFERKTIGDLFGTMGKGYERFKKEMERARESKSRLVLIIEGSYSKIGKGYKYSMIKGMSMKLKLFTLQLRYGLQFVPLNSRSEMSDYITDWFISEGREYTRKKKAANEINPDREAVVRRSVKGVHDKREGPEGSDS